jgi:hypothetical protein
MSKTEIWDALGKTDPGATKPFSRAGGFKGTGVKPMWILRRMTEQFGPAGVGWGVNEPKFETVIATEGEVLVYCTVSCWHGSKDNVLWGVGGDKAVAIRSGKLFTDDEAFKKAFTDAINNAFKSLGVAADIHMGLFDDDKYVSAMEREFAEASDKTEKINEDQRTELMALIEATGVPVAEVLEVGKITDLRDMHPADFDDAKRWINKQAQQRQRKAA